MMVVVMVMEMQGRRSRRLRSLQKEAQALGGRIRKTGGVGRGVQKQPLLVRHALLKHVMLEQLGTGSVVDDGEGTGTEASNKLRSLRVRC